MCPSTSVLIRCCVQIRPYGMGLPVAIFVVLIMSVFAVVATRLVLESAEVYSRSYLSTQAFYAAESAAQLNMAILLNTPGATAATCVPPINFTTSGLYGCQATVVCIDRDAAASAVTYINAVGQCGVGIDQAQRQVQVLYKR